MKKTRPRVAVELLKDAVRDDERTKAWQMWLQRYPAMVTPSPYAREGKPLLTFMPFDEYYNDKRPGSISNRPAEEILREAESIRRRIKRQVN